MVAVDFSPRVDVPGRARRGATNDGAGGMEHGLSLLPAPDPRGVQPSLRDEKPFLPQSVD